MSMLSNIRGKMLCPYKVVVVQVQEIRVCRYMPYVSIHALCVHTKRLVSIQTGNHTKMSSFNIGLH